MRVDKIWNSALDRVVDDLLQRIEIHAPPVDAWKMTQKFGIDVAFDHRQSVRGRQKRLAGRPSIFLKPEERPERLQWTIAHEMGEVVSYRVFEERNFSQTDFSPDQREAIANTLASRILLPSRWFYEDARDCCGDVLKLKRRYATASHELIAWRLLDLSQQTIITICDQGRITRRRGNGPSPPSLLRKLERHCWSAVRSCRSSVEVSNQQLCVQGWPIYEKNWKREILRTTPAYQLEPDFV